MILIYTEYQSLCTLGNNNPFVLVLPQFLVLSSENLNHPYEVVEQHFSRADSDVKQR